MTDKAWKDVEDGMRERCLPWDQQIRGSVSAYRRRWSDAMMMTAVEGHGRGLACRLGPTANVGGLGVEPKDQYVYTPIPVLVSLSLSKFHSRCRLQRASTNMDALYGTIVVRLVIHPSAPAAAYVSVSIGRPTSAIVMPLCTRQAHQPVVHAPSHSGTRSVSGSTSAFRPGPVAWRKDASVHARLTSRCLW